MFTVNNIKKGLIVSCQAAEDEPLYGSDYMARMALAAEIGGAVGVRVNSTADITAVKKLVKLPVIGIIKKDYPNSKVRITPTMKEIYEVYEAGAEIVAVDCTFRKRPDNMAVASIISETKKNCPGLLFMADISTAEEGVFAYENGADIVATTLAGYPDNPESTKDRIEFMPPSLDVVEELSKTIKCPVFCEGRVGTVENAIKALDLGAYCVVIGWAITRPQIITLRIVEKINQFFEEKANLPL